MRINKFISAYSKHSRRSADELILNGKVFVNGEKIKTPGIRIDPKKDKIKVNGKFIVPRTDKIYIALNKPANYITTRNDEKNRQTVMMLVPKIPNLKPIGRLDGNTEGLLLFSNDGEFINRLTHPRYNCPKEYYVELNKELTQEEKSKLEKGIVIEGKKTHPAKISDIKTRNDKTTLTIEIHEGRNRQIRKMFQYLNHDVKYLRRIRIGTIKLGDLKVGKYRPLTKKEINDQQSA